MKKLSYFLLIIKRSYFCDCFFYLSEKVTQYKLCYMTNPDTKRVIILLAKWEEIYNIIVSFSVGLLTSFNPCMLGMASSIFTFKGESKNKSILPITLTFMISFTLTFTILGVVSIFLVSKY